MGNDAGRPLSSADTVLWRQPLSMSLFHYWPDRPFKASSQLFLSRMRHGIVKCSQIKSELNCFHFPSVSSLSLSSPCVCDYLWETGVLETEQSRIRQLYLILQSSLPSYAEPCDTHAARCHPLFKSRLHLQPCYSVTLSLNITLGLVSLDSVLSALDQPSFTPNSHLFTL